MYFNRLIVGGIFWCIRRGWASFLSAPSEAHLGSLIAFNQPSYHLRRPSVPVCRHRGCWQAQVAIRRKESKIFDRRDPICLHFLDHRQIAARNLHNPHRRLTVLCAPGDAGAYRPHTVYHAPVSLAFSETGSAFIGDLKYFGLKGVLEQPSAIGSTRIPSIPHPRHRRRRRALQARPLIVFVFVWSTLVYDPIACWTWNSNG
ncbi:hypothetical protein FIBSPDRAFT_1048800 [Athelia psychrophila]|uniref:Secreted protein n=1 Tax=Athelia psychrophila TaxID=1759441 RepID=A0A166DA24_9AGAM|nr:hypothetical protein FIBSPDRAFT_1048800 [Fibularhizoctonia sp. CBS 109695]